MFQTLGYCIRLHTYCSARNYQILFVLWTWPTLQQSLADSYINEISFIKNTSYWQEGHGEICWSFAEIIPSLDSKRVHTCHFNVIVVKVQSFIRPFVHFFANKVKIMQCQSFQELAFFLFNASKTQTTMSGQGTFDVKTTINVFGALLPVFWILINSSMCFLLPLLPFTVRSPSLESSLKAIFKWCGSTGEGTRCPSCQVDHSAKTTTELDHTYASPAIRVLHVSCCS